jgi:DNA-binding CsgD family transcriptional regulator
MKLELADWEIINECLLHIYRETEPTRHTRVMLEVVGRLAPGRYIVLNKMHIPTRRFSLESLPAGLAEREEIPTIVRYLDQSPFVHYYVATGDPQWKTISDFMPVEDFYATELHQLGLSRVGVNSQMCGMLAVVDQVAYGLTINRSDDGFSERERAMLNVLHPHLVTSFLNAQSFAKAQNSLTQLKSVIDAAPGAYGYFNGERQLAWLQPLAQAWLSTFFNGDTQNPAGLPESIARLIVSARDRAVHLDQTNATHRLSVCILPAALGGWILRLENQPLRSPSHFRPLPQFSVRKNEVLKWMVEGKRNSEIAAILCLSTRTVEKHVSEILASLKVENRATAIIRAMELCAAVSTAIHNPPSTE